MNMDELADEIHATAKDKGFWDHTFALPDNEPDWLYVCASDKIALMHSELSEALSALRDEDWPHVEEELADTIIRILDFCGAFELSIDQALAAKIEINKSRPRLHGHLH